MTILLFDACAYINLNNIYVNERHVLVEAERLFDVQTPQEIIRELNKDKQKALLGDNASLVISAARSRRRTFRKVTAYEQLLFTSFHQARGHANPNPDKNRGERFICALALHRLMQRSAPSVVIVTDDRKATNEHGFIRWFGQSFKHVQVWSSLDFLLFMYLHRHDRWSVDRVRAALREVNALIYRSALADNPKRASERTPEQEAQRNKVNDLALASLTMHVRELTHLHQFVSALD